VRGTAAIQRVLELTAVEEMLVLVDDPDDLVPPPPSRTDLRAGSGNRWSSKRSKRAWPVFGAGRVKG
jgi:hypothetical protein